MDDKQRETRRSHYRLRYPPASQPTIEIGDVTYQVAEISEAGARIVLQGAFSVAPSEAFSGDVKFHDGEDHFDRRLGLENSRQRSCSPALQRN